MVASNLDVSRGDGDVSDKVEGSEDVGSNVVEGRQQFLELDQQVQGGGEAVGRLGVASADSFGVPNENVLPKSGVTHETGLEP